MKTMIATPAGTKNDNRKYYLDWIRVLTILVVFLFHCLRFFDYDDWHVKNNVLSSGASLLTFFLVQWMMPLFFFISGASTWYALQFKPGGKFITDRVKRILVPLVFGIFILSPHQVYLERVSHQQFHGSLVEFLPYYFNGLYAFGGNFAWMGLHLWYLLLLFIFSLIALPLFLLIKKQSHRAFFIPLLAFPVFVIILSIPGIVFSPDQVIGSRVWGGWNMIEHLLLLILGYYAFSKQGIINSLVQYRYIFLIITVLATCLNLYVYANHILFNFGTIGFTLKIVLRATVCLGWIFTILGFADRKLNFTNSFLAYGNEAVLPFYVLHQPVIVLIGYFIVQQNLPIGFKYLLISVISLLIVMTLYHFLVRRVPFLRFLFGMGKKKQTAVKNQSSTAEYASLKMASLSNGK